MDAGHKRHAPLGDRIPPSADDAPGNRKRTTGETVFDLTTYGGFALIGNEITATAIVKQADKPNAIGKLYRSAEAFTKKVGPKNSSYVQNRMNYINFAILGGMMMVPFIKVLEDNKGKLVRFADRAIHGKHAEIEPDMVRAHEEMDNAPKQTWGSLWKGRALTVAAAWAVDATLNWKDGLSARALKGTKFEKYGSFEAVSTRFADKVGDSLAKSRGYDMAKTANIKSWLGNGFGLLTLSAALTVLFYATSKFFAKRRDHREEVYNEVHANAPAPSIAMPDAQEQTAQKNDAPVPMVNAIAHEARLAATPELGREA